VTIQILNYEFLGPIRLSEWGPPMEEVLYLILTKSKDAFQIIHVGESGKTDDAAFFTKNEKFKCWLGHSSEQNLHLCIYPMWGSAPEERQKIVRKIASKYAPPCNSDDTNTN
jgi:hypothetical protein